MNNNGFIPVFEKESYSEERNLLFQEKTSDIKSDKIEYKGNIS